MILFKKFSPDSQNPCQADLQDGHASRFGKWQATSAQCRNVIWVSLYLTLIFVALFSAFPRLDLTINAMFVSAQHPFAIQFNPYWKAVRATMIALTDGVMTCLLMWWIAGMIWPRVQRVRQSVLGFMIGCYIAVPGLIVNLGLKHHWGRARPRNITEYGGGASFTPPLQLADQCHGSCSFVSGEASALFTVGTLVILLVVPALAPRLRLPAICATVAIAVFGSALRVAFGGHFASDVIFAALLSVCLTVGLYQLSGLGQRAPSLPLRRPIARKSTTATVFD
ncbi:hypothetical protein BFP70_13025 [Thioclava sp. SK-1]|uniref:phosphatase PAP2 family protein n=1 Tax=Thioclava sp. SK-1 TaxID=1889770 RepID=UPI0008244E0C|nr:phosphatase PAP2 family protein [Thioclava sp. SK-1]OCX63126.1 hypothetical protein BFP70_13025 [Thioclava sp. SK-1]